MSGYAFWLLDLDGTILTVEDDYIHETIGSVGERLDRRFTAEEAVAIWFGRDGLRNEILTDAGIDPVAFWSAFHDIEDAEARAAATYLHPDAEVVTDLPGPRAVVTHCQPYLLEPVLDRLGIHDWFDAIVTGSDRIGWKPDPAPVRLAMERLQVNGEPGVLVGDSVADVQAARNAGLTGILIDREGTATASSADRVIGSLTELV